MHAEALIPGLLPVRRQVFSKATQANCQFHPWEQISENQETDALINTNFQT